MGLFYWDVDQQTVLGAKETSEMMTKFGWRGGWRAEDYELTLMEAQGTGGGQESLLFLRYPIVYIIETATMKIVAGEKLFDYDDDNLELDVLAEVQKINAKYN